MRALVIPALIVVLLGSMNAIADGPATLGYANNHDIEPVLVHVNAQGKITDISPAYKLSPDLMKLLRSNLADMIHTPAKDKDGKPMASQFIINLALQTDALSTGGYNVHFAYVSASPVPTGSWYWGHDSTGKLGLVSRDVLNNFTNMQSSFTPSAPPATISGNYGGRGR
ncbi:hypothetical protein [Dyella mobilis]|uniref:Uncharacterized protein n=1 Tax=Dyella mobilis TaxID=1849582 RepID=A0ABS2KF51_9GAMM|nr:hypothetical protein [Dyella mobilis]MBM7129574.1 hypothetical protein [Dyella mobilis]GLQ98162.1 hypothetical protein GCM10007863_25820 [Dyella mobilis]